jgi:hypothetical protein
VRAAICNWQTCLLADMRFNNITRSWRLGQRTLGASQTKTSPCGKQEHCGGKNFGDDWHCNLPFVRNIG